MKQKEFTVLHDIQVEMSPDPSSFRTRRRLGILLPTPRETWPVIVLLTPRIVKAAWPRLIGRSTDQC